MKFASRGPRLAAALLRMLLALAAASPIAACRRAHRHGPGERPDGAPGPASASASASAATLSGRVVDARGRPVPGARVLALRLRGPAETEAAFEATADADGRFAVARLAAGRYRLLVEAPGFASAEPPPFQLPGSDIVVALAGDATSIAGRVLAAGAPAGGARVRLAAAAGATAVRETATRADGSFSFAGLGSGAYRVRADRGALASPAVEARAGEPGSLELALQPGASIPGRVVDDRGAAVPDAEVRLESGADDPLPELARTDATGRFAAGPLPPGERRLLARKAGYVARGPITVPVPEGQPRALPPVTLELARAAHLAGSVTDARGAPLAGATVRCLGRGTEELAVLLEPLPLAAEAAALPPASAGGQGGGRAVRSDAAGRFDVGDLLPGPLRLEVLRAGAVPLRTTEWTLHAGERRDVGALALRDGVPVSGRVLDDEDQPIEGAHVGARAAAGDPAGAGDLGLYAVTDGSGRFALALPPGRRALAITAPGRVGATAPVHVVEGAPPPAELTVKLTRADGVLEGLVKDDAGRPLARAQVTAWPLDKPGDAAPFGSALADAGGHFSIAHVPRRPLLIEAHHHDYATATATATPGTPVTVTVPVPGGIRGEVREQVTGAAVAGFRVEASGPDGRTAVAARPGRGTNKGGGDGAFTLERLVPGRWRLVATAPGFSSLAREVEVPPGSRPGEPSVLDLRLELQSAH
jgi:protocatechuate 3,4-dioxygenase beta subunit